jgi:hypothetical protein
MKTIKGFLGILTLSLVVVGPAYAAYEGTVSPLVPQKTLVDFQKEYSGTKPVVASLKYYDYLKNAPNTTLDVSHIR